MWLIILIIAMLTAAFTMGAIDIIHDYRTTKKTSVSIDIHVLHQKRLAAIVMSIITAALWVVLFMML